MTEKRSLKKINDNKVAKKLLAFFGFLLLLLFLPFSLYVYAPLGKYSYGILKHLPYPVAIINKNSIITTSELIKDSDSVRHFYLSQDFSKLGLRVDFSTEEGKKRLKIKEKDVLDKLVENRILEKLAKDRGIEITSKQAQAEIDNKISLAGDKQTFALNLKKLYGWSVEEFRDKIVIPQLYLEALSEYYYQHEREKDEGYNKISKAKEALKPDGSNFSEISEKYSDGESSKNGGELGWFGYDQLTPEVAKAIFELKPGSISNIIQSSLGFHIIQIEEFRDAPEAEKVENSENSQMSQPQKEVKIKQIFVASGGLIGWIEQQKKNSSVIVLMKDYIWSKDKGAIKFRNEDMNKQEQSLRIKADGDPTMN